MDDLDDISKQLDPYLTEAMEKAMVHPEYENLAILVCLYKHTDGETSATAPMFICYQYPDDQFDFTFDIVAAKVIIRNGFEIWCIKHLFEMGCGCVPYEVAAKLLKDIREKEQ